jgi:ankyrin repeat protein
MLFYPCLEKPNYYQSNGCLEVVKALLDAKADVNAKTSKGDTALRLASKNGHKEVVQILKGAGAAGR